LQRSQKEIDISERDRNRKFKEEKEREELPEKPEEAIQSHPKIDSDKRQTN
jgi:hypothetical protein